MSQYTPEQRRFILEEIDQWRKENLITENGARLLRRRYLEPVATPAALEQAPVEQSAAAPPQNTAPSVPLAPRPTLAQTLLSETSIKIALYLGAFFVIAAALILAALVANLRLPILLSVSLLFGLGALVLKKRLAQPSFILWLVFSALLPISAGVLADLLQLTGTNLSAYWVVVLAGMAFVWGASTWFYQSRFFSLMAFGALATAMWFLAAIFEPKPNLYLFMLAAAGVAGLLGAWALKEWQSQKFALPLFLVVQLYELIVLFTAFIFILISFGNDYFHAWWLFAALTWLAAFTFYTLSDIILPFPVFPFMAIGALMPVTWLALNEYDPSQIIFALGLGIWGFVLALCGEILGLIKLPKLKRYALPLALASIPLLFIGGFWGLNTNQWLGLGIFAVVSVLLTLMQIRQARWWLWAAGSAAWLITYFAFFNLDIITQLKINSLYITTGACLLLALPDWFFPGTFKEFPTWRWPQRSFLLLLVATTSIASLFDSPISVQPAITFGILAATGLIYALRFKLPILLFAFTAYTALAAFYGLKHFDLPQWLPTLAALSAGYYLFGSLLARNPSREQWSAVLRWSGLALGLIISVAAFNYPGPGAGWYVGALGIFFVVETFGRASGLEICVHFLYALAIALVLNERKISDPNLYLMGISVMILGLDVFFARTLSQRSPIKWLARAAGWLVALGGNALLLFQWKEATGIAVAVSVTYAILFLAYALLYRNPRLGYIYFAALPVTVLTAANFAGLEKWSGVLILLALLYYALSFLDKPTGWGVIRRHCGLILATLTAISAPFEGSGLWGSLPVALAATLWAMEAFRRRNVWLGFPANGLYLLAYFMILATLKVDQPQFYSVGAALLGLLMHYLLMRSGANFGAFLTGMVSQLVLLGTTYIQMVANNSLGLFAALFFQSIVVLVYGLVIRSRSLVFTPLVFVVVGVFTVVFSLPFLRGIGTVILIGCTGILFILLGIIAVLMRERLAELRDRLSDWKA